MRSVVNRLQRHHGRAVIGESDSQVDQCGGAHGCAKMIVVNGNTGDYRTVQTS